jgi:hypothetical protein
MFHGHKGFDEVQTDLLKPSIIILRKIAEILYSKLKMNSI